MVDGRDPDTEEQFQELNSIFSGGIRALITLGLVLSPLSLLDMKKEPSIQRLNDGTSHIHKTDLPEQTLPSAPLVTKAPPVPQVYWVLEL